MKVITNKGPVPLVRGIQGQDFIGSVRTIVNPESIDDVHILLIDSFFAWNSLAIQATTEPVTIFVTLSDPSKLDSALWIPLEEAPGCPESYVQNNSVAPGKVILFAHENPITAFKFVSSGNFRLDWCCKSPA